MPSLKSSVAKTVSWVDGYGVDRGPLSLFEVSWLFRSF